MVYLVGRPLRHVLWSVSIALLVALQVSAFSTFGGCTHSILRLARKNYRRPAAFRSHNRDECVLGNSENNYWERQPEEESHYDTFNGNHASSPQQWESHQQVVDWESTSDGEALVLLPPEGISRPKAVVHFIGGTFFGSTPKIWYRSLLEDLVRKTQCACIVTPIPLTFLSSPMQHVSLSKQLRSSFEHAWENVLEDEYGDLSDIPLFGLGHSLGARLLVVQTTLTKNGSFSQIPPYLAFALVSFTNFGASSGIPGVSALLKESHKQEHLAQIARGRDTKKNRNPSGRYTRSGQGNGGWDGLIDNLWETVGEQTNRFRTALTPRSEDLEFHPSPEMLWGALKSSGRYCLNETLVVQFDDDKIDQSAKLAKVLHETNSTSVKFCRLRGTHLTPVGVHEGDTAGLLDLTSTGSQTIWDTMRGQRRTKSQHESMRNLQQSVARFVMEVAAKRSVREG